MLLSEYEITGYRRVKLKWTIIINKDVMAELMCAESWNRYRIWNDRDERREQFETKLMSIACRQVKKMPLCESKRIKC